MKRNTKLVSINNTPMIIYDSPECISDDIVKYNNFWEFELFDKWKTYFPVDGLFLDIGANIGSHCLQFKYNFPNIKILAFEPYLENFLLLKQNTQFYKDIKCFNVGVGSKTSIVHFTNGSLENSGVVRVDSFEENNPNLVISLDDLYFNEPVKFIKIDIEGHEYSAFEGMLELIKKDKPMIWLEDNEQVAVPYLQSLGYNILEKNELTEDYLMI